MVAIFVGSGFGTDRGSLRVLGGQGQIGDASLGRGGLGAYVNAATGALDLQRVDEVVIGKGPDEVLASEYDSTVPAGWFRNAINAVFNATGPVNSAGSTITRVGDFNDRQVFTYETARGAYVFRGGAGAYDEIRFEGGIWSFKDGDTQRTDYFEQAWSGGIFYRSRSVDCDLNTQSFAYDVNGNITRITNADNSYTELTGYVNYRPTSVKTTFLNAQGVNSTLTRVHYVWDTSPISRLVSVVVDLSPEDGLTSDGNVYATDYTYDGTSQRIASITQTDGSRLDISYDGSNRVASYTQTVSAGVTRTTSFDYSVAGRTTVTDPAGQKTILFYDSSNQLTQITYPAIDSNTTPRVVQFSYNANGDVTSVTGGPGDVTTYEYDANGNRTLERDSAGNLIRRTYGSRNELLTERRYPQPNTPLTTRYTYDSENHLAYAVSAEGHVTRYEYDVPGRQSAVIEYGGASYTLTGVAEDANIDIGLLNSWAAGQTATQRTETAYNNQGTIRTDTSWSKLSGGLFDTSSELSQTTYVYDSYGNLLSRTRNGSSASEVFVYDGLGRQTIATDFNGAATRSFFYDAQGMTIVAHANGLSEIATFDKAGELIARSEAQGNLAPDLANPLQWIVGGLSADGAGTLDGAPATLYTVQTNGTPGAFYSNANVVAGDTLTFEISLRAGGTFPTTTDSLGIFASLSGWGGATDSTAAIVSGPGALTQTGGGLWNVSNLSTSQTTRIRVTRTFTTAEATNSIFYVSGTGTPVQGAAAIVSAPLIMRTNPVSQPQNVLTGTESYRYDALGRLRMVTDRTGRSNYYLYDNIGRKTADIDADGSVIEYRYDGNDNLTSTTRYATRLSVGQLALLANFDSGGGTGGGATGSTLLTNGSFDTSGAHTATTTGLSNIDLPGWIKANPEPYEQVSAGQLGVTGTDGAYWLDLDSVPGSTIPTGPNLLANGSFDQSGAYTDVSFGRTNPTLPSWLDAYSQPFQQVASGQMGVTASNGAYWLDLDTSVSTRVAVGSNLVLNGSFEQSAANYTPITGGRANTTLPGWTKVNPQPFEQMVGGDGQVTPSDGIYWLDLDAAGGTFPGPNLLVNGSFEQSAASYTTISTGRLNSSSQNIPGWTKANSQGFEQVNSGVYGTAASDGSFYLDMEASGGAGSKMDISQTISLASAQSLTLHFDYANTAGMVEGGDGPENSGALNIYWNGTLIGQLGFDSASFVTEGFTFTGQAGTNTLRFVEVGPTDGRGVSLDNVQLYTTPTPVSGGNMDIIQTVPSLTAGQIMQLQFDYANRTTATSGSFQVLWNGQVIDTISDPLPGMQAKSYFVTAVAGNNAIEFRGTGTVDNVGASLDNVQLHATQLVSTPGNMEISQTVTGLAAGQTMQLTFDYANRTTAASGSFQVLWNGQVIDTIADTGATMQTKSYSVTALAGNNVVGFRGIGTADDVGASLDNVRLYATTTLPDGGNMDFSQTVSGLTAGQVMLLQFNHANRTSAASGSFEVYWNDVLIGTVSETVAALQTGAYRVVARGGNNVLRFKGTGTVDAVGASIDNVRLYATGPVSYGSLGASLRDIRPSPSANDAWNWQVYDSAQRVVQTIDGTGATSVYTYDGASRVTSTTTYANRLSSTILDSLKAEAINPNFWSNPNDGALWAQSDLTVAATATSIDGAPAYQFSVYQASQWEGFASDFVTANAGDTISYTISMKGVGSTTTDVVGVYSFYPSSWGANSDGTATIVSGPGTISQWVGGLFGVSGLSTTDATRITITRKITQDDTVRGYFYIATTDYLGQNLAGASVIAAAPVYLRSHTAAINLPTADAANDRVARNFYDSDGRLVGTLDGEGYLTEIRYDSAGRKTQTIFYSAAPTTASGAFSAVRGSITADTAKDIHNHFVYDARGFLRATVDGEGNLTRYHYDAMGNLDQQARGQTVDPTSLINTPPTLANLPAPPAGTVLETISYTRNANGQVLTETKILAGGVSETTSYSYDAVGRLIARTDAAATVDARTLTQRYDARGNLIGQLTGEGSAALLALGANPSQAAIDNVYATWGTTYTYDAAGRLISKAEANGVNAAGNRTLYYYDADGSLAYQVNALGEVVEYRYNALGERTDTVAYGTRIAPGNLPGLSGGAVTTSFLGLVAGIANASLDSVSHLDYNVTGTVSQSIDPLSNVSTYAYNAFGEIKARVDPLDGANLVQTDYLYDRRGLVKSEKRDSTAGGLQLETINAYDPFGRLTQVTDPAGRVRGTNYDRAGRVSLTTDALGKTQSFSYDGRGNVLTVMDRTGATTTFTYDAFNRTMTTTTPGLVVTTIKNNAYGQTISIRDGALHETTYTYDKSGNLKTETNAASNQVQHNYDSAGRLKETIDARGFKTSYTYDAANRLFTEKADDGGLNLVTTYEYDAKGQGFRITDPANRVTTMEFDKDGRKTAVVVDSGGLALRTEYGYDKSGRILTVTEGAGTAAARVTQYEYDKADRLFRTRIDPAGLNLITTYSYDKAGNVAQRTDAANAVTTYAYDAENRLTRALDAESGVVETYYDNEGRVTGTRRFANAGSAAAAANGAFTISVVPDNARDQVVYQVYDADGRMRFRIDGQSRPTQYVYDGAGNVIRKIDYTGAIAYLSTDDVASVQGKIAAAGLAATRLTRAVYDAANRLAFNIDAENRVTAFAYDGNGNVIKQVRYANLFTLAGDQNLSAMQGWVGTYADSSNDRTSRTLYDGASRVSFQVDAENYVTEYQYDAASRVTRQIRHALNNWSIGDTTTQAGLAGQIGAPTAAAAQIGFAYDTAGRLIDKTDPTGSVTHFVLDALGQATDTILAYNVPAEASTTHRIFDKAGRVLSETVAYNVPAEATTTSYVYDGMGRARYVTDGRANVTEYIYDGLGHVIHEIQPLDATASAHIYREYDKFGNVAKLTDPRGNAAFYYYDALNRPSLQIDPEGYATRTTYTIGGEVASVTRYDDPVSGATTTAPPTIPVNALGSTTTFTRDKLDRVTGVIDAENYAQTYVLNAFGDRTSVTVEIDRAPNTPRTVTTTYVYDRLGRVRSETLPVGSTLANGDVQSTSVTNTFEYDARGNLKKKVEASGLAEARTTNYGYDNANRLISKSGDLVQVVAQDLVTTSWVTPTETYKYDSCGDLIETLVAATGARTLSYYDHLGRKIAEINPVGTFSKWTWDANGNMTSALVYGFAVGLPALAGGNPPPPVNSDTYRLTTYDYDRSNRQTFTTVAGLRTGEYGGASFIDFGNVVTQKVYDAAGNVIREIDGRNNSVWSFYDRLGRRIAKVDQENYLTVWTLDGEGNARSETRYANQITGAFGASTDLATLKTLAGANPVEDRTTQFVYDRDGRRTWETRLNFNGKSLTSAGALQDAGANAEIHYEYNGLGQVTRKTEANGDFTEFSYDGLGRQTSVQSALYTDYQGASVRKRSETYYDGLGDVTRSAQKSNSGVAANDRVTQYFYGNGAGGRLTSVIDAAGFTREYGYDADGRIVKESYGRKKSDDTILSEAIAYRYDLAGRLNFQATATWVNGAPVLGDATQLRYNAFGEVTGKGVNVVGDAYQETFDYDTGGRMWRSTSGDGSARIYLYDKAGNATLTIASAGTADLLTYSLESAAGTIAATGATSIGGAVTTVSIFDKRGQNISNREPSRELAAGSIATIIRSRVYNAFGEVKQETDALNHVSNYTYNTAGNITKREMPFVNYTTEAGVVVSNTRPTEVYSYDLSGRLIGVQDANNAVITRRLLGGTGYAGSDATVLAEYHPDGGVAAKAVDEFGDVRTSTDEINRVTGYNYDKMGRLTQLNHAGGLVDNYAYDGLGQRIKHWNSVYNLSAVDRTDYDAMGRVVSLIQASGLAEAATVLTSYAWNGNLVTNGLGTFGGWVKTTTYGGRTVNNIATESTDYFGRVVGKTDLGLRTYAFTYNKAGWITGQTSSVNQSLAFTYFNTGKAATVTDSYVNSVYSPNSVQSTFAYDAAGNRVFEGYTKTSYQYDWYTGYTTPFTQSLQAAAVTYDELGRMKSFSDSGVTGSNPATVNWEYDRVGNIRRVLSTYSPIVQDPNNPGAQYTTDRWYTYDPMNRMVQVDGWMNGGHIENDVSTVGSGFAAYDKAGQRVSFTTNFFEFDGAGAAWGQYREDYSYTPDGYLWQVKQAKAYVDQTTFVLSNFSPPVLLATDTRDALGRLTAHSEYSGASVVYSRSATFNALSQMTSESTSTLQYDNATLTTNSTFDYRAETSAGSGIWTGEYQGGVVTHVHTNSSRNFVAQPVADTINSYVWWDDAQLSVVTNKPSPTLTYTSTYSYDENGKLASVNIQDGRPRTVNYVTDLNGQVMSRTEYSPAADNPKEIYYYFNGIRVGDVGNNGPSQTDYVTAIGQRGAPPQNGPFQNQYGFPMANADFEQAFSPINPSSGGNSGTTYTIREGDSLRSIAQMVWGDADMWYLLAEANGLRDSSALTAGQTLTIPAKIANVHNNSETFRVYDPNKAIGDNSPNQAVQPKPQRGGGGCGMLGKIILIAVAVAITVILKVPVTNLIMFGSTVAPVAATTAAGVAILAPVSAAAAIAGAAVTGAIASVVSQGIGVATGIQNKFSWKGVALSALSAGITQGVGNGALISGAGKFVNDAARGALVNAATQGAAVATGLQKKFDWAGIAVAGVVSGVTGAISRTLPGAPRYEGVRIVQAGSQGNTFASGLAGAVAGASVRSVVTGTSFGDNILAVLPDVIGSTIGTMIGEGIARGGGASRGRGSSDAREAPNGGSADYDGDGIVGRMEVGADDNTVPLGELLQAASSQEEREQIIAHRTAAVRRRIVLLESAGAPATEPGFSMDGGTTYSFAPNTGSDPALANDLLTKLASGEGAEYLTRYQARFRGSDLGGLISRNFGGNPDAIRAFAELVQVQATSQNPDYQQGANNFVTSVLNAVQAEADYSQRLYSYQADEFNESLINNSPTLSPFNDRRLDFTNYTHGGRDYRSFEAMREANSDIAVISSLSEHDIYLAYQRERAWAWMATPNAPVGDFASVALVQGWDVERIQAGGRINGLTADLVGAAYVRGAGVEPVPLRRSPYEPAGPIVSRPSAFELAPVVRIPVVPGAPGEVNFILGEASAIRTVNIRPPTPGWGLTPAHLNKHFFGNGPYSLTRIDPGGTADQWMHNLTTLYNLPVTSRTSNGMLDIKGEFPRADGSGTYRMGIRLSPNSNGTFDLVTVLTRQH